MEQDDIKKIFDDFAPELDSDENFMAIFQRNINAAELIRRHSILMRRRNKRALVFASLAGFVIGVLFSLALPWVSGIVEGIHLNADSPLLLCKILDNWTLAAWTFIAVSSMFVSYNVYDTYVSFVSDDSCRP